MKNITWIAFAILALCTLFIFGFTKEEDSSPDILNRTNGVSQVIESVDFNKTFDFAGELIPVDQFDVKERLDREITVNTYYHSNTILNIKRANKYFPAIEPILAKNNIPQDFKYLAVAESSLSNAVSPAGARGFWQFMERTGEAYDLEINNEVDERYHLEKSTEAFCQYIAHYKEEFGSWLLAAAAYNMGGPNLRKSMEVQRASTYFDLNLSQETNRYVFRLVALKEILSNQKDFGFYIEKDQLYEPLGDYYLLEVAEPIENLGDFANKYGISYRMLKIYNPWLLTSKLTNQSRKTYKIKIPKQKID